MYQYIANDITRRIYESCHIFDIFQMISNILHTYKIAAEYSTNSKTAIDLTCFNHKTC